MYRVIAPADPRFKPEQIHRLSPSAGNVQFRPHPHFGVPPQPLHRDPAHFPYFSRDSTHFHHTTPMSPTSPVGMVGGGAIHPAWGRGGSPVPLPPPLPFYPPFRYPPHHPHSQPRAGMGMGNFGNYFNPMPGGSGVRSHDQSGSGWSPATSERKDPFIEKWLDKVGKNKPEPLKKLGDGDGAGGDGGIAMEEEEEGKGVGIKIPEVRSLLKKGVELLTCLRSAYRDLNSVPLSDDVQWNNSKMKAEISQKEFLDIRSKLDLPDFRKHLVAKATRLRKRRDRDRRGWKKRKKAWHERREGLEKMTDDWVKEKQEKALKTRMEKDVQASAIGVLEEVKRKKADIKKLLEIAEAIMELRTLRREASRKKGDAPPVEADEAFNETHASLVDMLTRQSSVCESEEHALRVLMEEEVKEKIHTHHSNVAKARVHNIDLACSTQLDHMTSDPMDPYKRFYLQANDSKEIMHAIRSDWDVYLRPEGSVLPSSPELVAPAPSSLAWEQFIHEDEL